MIPKHLKYVVSMPAISSLPSADHHRTAIVQPKAIHRGLDAIVHDWWGRIRHRDERATRLRQEANAVRERAGVLAEIADDLLRSRMEECRALFRRGETVSSEVESEALACVAEAARRVLGRRPHTVQLMGALAASRGYLLEMATGEGKTLTVSLAAALAAWSGRPCHILTANDYLASRDVAWLQPFYAFCGLTAGCVTGEMKPQERRANYHRDITYTTSKEVVADFLRDRLQLGPLANSTRRLLRTMLQPGAAAQDGLVMRGLYTAVVDEADSALIDEAVTPLIISRKEENEPLRLACEAAHRVASILLPDQDYGVNEKFQEVILKPAGFAKLEKCASEFPKMWRGRERRNELIIQALRAREFFHLGKQYVVEEGKIVIVDEFTGRLMHERTWREGLHQAVEAKEGLQVSAPAETLARLSFQRFFRLYRRLSGLSGTIWEAAPEVWQIYRLPVVRIPTNKPCLRREEPDRVFATQEEKWQALVTEIARLHQQRQPVLVGTRSVAASEHLAKLLESRGLPYNLLNATRHHEEAEIVALAGEQGRITIATNMAGRGTDVKLGPLVAEIGGLHVLLTERHESRRIDRQLMGRAARQGDPGSAQAFVSMEDELLVRHAANWIRERIKSALAAGTPGAEYLASKLIDRAQRNSERQAFHQRRRVLETDVWIEDSLSFTGTEFPG